MKRNLTASITALCALTCAQAAQAQQPCIASADLDDTVLYAMPIAYDAAMAACGASYTGEGFMKSEGAAFADRFRAKQGETWPGAFRVLKTFGQSRAASEDANGSGDLDITALLDSMPPETLRPFVDILFQQVIAEKIDPDTCDKIERGVSLIAPLPVENVSGLVTFIAEMSELKEPGLCPADPASETTMTESSE